LRRWHALHLSVVFKPCLLALHVETVYSCIAYLVWFTHSRPARFAVGWPWCPTAFGPLPLCRARAGLPPRGLLPSQVVAVVAGAQVEAGAAAVPVAATSPVPVPELVTRALAAAQTSPPVCGPYLAWAPG
jgi:hypothetical protein